MPNIPIYTLYVMEYELVVIKLKYLEHVVSAYHD